VDTNPWIVGGGLVVGFLYGLFGVGSAFATPILSLLGVPGMAAVVGPLPALLPGSAAGAWSYSRRGEVDWAVARAALAGAAPAAVIGAIASRHVGGPVLLGLSGVVLLFVGLRIVRPGHAVAADAAARRRGSTAFVTLAAAGVGFAAGLLANGGGFLLVPLFLLALGLDMHEAAGTSLVVAFALTVPTLITHTLIGDIDWAIAGMFALGLVPGVLLGGRIAHLIPTARLRYAFGVVLIAFAVWFLARQALAFAA
jgi:uncharacterized membrane protein YfcA